MTHYQIWQTTDRGRYLRFTYYTKEAANLAVTWLSGAEIVEVEVEEKINANP